MTIGQTAAQYANTAEVLAGAVQRLGVVDSFSNGLFKHNTWTTVCSAATDVPYVLTITRHDGVAVVVTYSEGAAGTTTTKPAGLAAAINANVNLKGYVVATAITTTLTVTSLLPGVRFVLSEADLQLNTPTETVLLSSSSAIPFGFGVVRDSGNCCKLPAGAGEFLGVAMRVQTIEQDGLTTTSFGAQNAVSVLAQGDIYVVTDETVAAGDAVYMRHTTGAGELGKFRNDADTAAAQLIVGAKFLTATSGAGIALARFV